MPRTRRADRTTFDAKLDDTDKEVARALLGKKKKKTKAQPFYTKNWFTASAAGALLVLMLVGGRYVTSGKVYEFVASGLPIVSAHEVEHDAAAVLEGHPLWTGAVGLNPRHLAESFSVAARLAVEATPEQRTAARAHADRYARPALLAPVVAEITERLAVVGAGR